MTVKDSYVLEWPISGDDRRPVRYSSIESARDIVRELWPWLEKEDARAIAHILSKAYKRR